MRTKNFFKASLLLLAAGLMFASCGSDEFKVQIVPDPMQETVEYYIAGKVTTADGAALSGVSVAAGEVTGTTDSEGAYILTVASKAKNYTVSFSLDGYMAGQDSYAALIPNTATNRSVLTLNAIMSKKGQDVNVTEELALVAEDEVLVVTEGGSTAEKKGETTADGGVVTGAPVTATVAVAIPKAAISTDAGTPSVSVTPYVAPVETTTAAPVQAALTNLKIDTKGQAVVLAEPVVMQVSAGAEVKEEETFEELKVYRKEDATGKAVRANDETIAGWRKIGTAIYNSLTKSYVFTIAKGERLDGDFSFRIEPTVTASGVKSKTIDSGNKSNAGNASAIDFTFDYKVTTGWDATISASVADATKSQLLSAIASSENGTQGYTTVTREFTAKISGNYILFYTVKANYVDKVYTFKLKGSNVKVNVTVYQGTDLEYVNKDASQHSGGGSN